MNMKPSFSLLAVLAVMALWPDDTQAADYTVNGWKIAVTVVPDSPVIMLDEPAWLSFKVENLSDENLQVVAGGDYRNALGRPSSFRIRVIDEQGRAVPQPKIGFEHGGMMWAAPLPAQSNYVFRLFLPDWARFERPGAYTFVCERTLQLLKPQADSSFLDKATNVDVSARTLLTVTASDPKRLGNLIDDLGRRILSEHDQVATDARKALASIQDERVLPWLLKSLELKTYGAKFYALSSLANYEAPAAVEGLKSALNLKGADLPNCCTTAQLADSLAKNLRVAAVHSLARNKNPDARKFLLEQRRGADDELRLTVVHMLGREKSEESASILKEMAADASKLVRSEAGRYLKERSRTDP
jgi:hypothetical protein